MKIKIEYSESIQITEGLWRKIGIELEDEGVIAWSDALHEKAKEYVDKWHKEANPDRQISMPKIVDPQADKEFDIFKSMIDGFNSGQSAWDFLVSSPFKYSIEAKKYVVEKFGELSK